MKTISIKISDTLAQELSLTANRLGSSKSNLVRIAIENFMHGSDSNPPLSCFDLASDIIGSAPGPTDLSTNPKYFEGFGE